MRAAAHDIWRTEDDRHPTLIRRGRRFLGRRKFGDGHAEFGRLLDMCERGVVMTRLRQLARPPKRRELAPLDALRWAWVVGASAVGWATMWVSDRFSRKIQGREG